jgi:predicted molibdopterin-dependent oxidoreductase YjgC
VRRHDDPETVFTELGRACAGGAADYSGITYRRIDDSHGLFWPCPDVDHPGTPRLFADRFATPDGRARFCRVEHVPPHEEPDAEHPYVPTTGRVLAQYQSGTQTRRSRSLQLIALTPRAEIHPDLARTRWDRGQGNRTVARVGPPHSADPPTRSQSSSVCSEVSSAPSPPSTVMTTEAGVASASKPATSSTTAAVSSAGPSPATLPTHAGRHCRTTEPAPGQAPTCTTTFGSTTVADAGQAVTG